MLLYEAAKMAGIQTTYEYAMSTDKGYMGLYGGLKAKDIAERKRSEKDQEILDHMGSEELGANLFRITQTDGRLRKENISDKHVAGEVHYKVGKEVRSAIDRIGGTMPEDLPTPETSVQELERKRKKEIKTQDKRNDDGV
ncbi:MAG: hypothetical protein FWD81_04100 [Methanomassiliicoccaceae archaeon]|nr:hypothetical protein [Methanomassiliicoccaceae archaeon]